MSSGYLDAEIGPSALCAAEVRPARSRPRIFLLSDVRLYREGLLWSLSRQDAFDVIGADECSIRTLTYLVELHPEVVILDVGAAEAFATANTLSSRLPITKIIAFAVSEVDDVVLACAEAGIAGYVAPNGSASDLISTGSSEPQTLTQRERQILDLVGEGKSNKEIGRALQISNATVKNHVHNILEKL